MNSLTSTVSSTVGAFWLMGVPALAQASPDLVTAPTEKVFVPVGFDSNDNVEVIVHGHFPNTCYKIGPATATIDYGTNTVFVEASAFVYSAAVQCAQMLIPFTESVNLGPVRPGTYRVVVKDRDTAETTELIVGEATTESADDFLYAPVDQASVSTLADGSRTLTLEGRYPYMFVGCMVMDEVRIKKTPGNVLVVQPITKLVDGSECKPQNATKAFTITTPISATLTNGEYLVHVRVLSGKSVNQLATLEGFTLGH